MLQASNFSFESMKITLRVFSVLEQDRIFYCFLLL